tara:strand:+ start:533 stop:1570 length:1038 start_codon:yes stop_codon:yes gene_type:complete
MMREEQYGSALASAWKLAHETWKDPDMWKRGFSPEELEYIESTVALAELILIAAFPPAAAPINTTRCFANLFDALARSAKGDSKKAAAALGAIQSCMYAMGRPATTYWQTLVKGRSDAGVAKLLGILSKKISKPLQRIVAALTNKALQQAWSTGKEWALPKVLGEKEYAKLKENAEIARLSLTEGLTASEAIVEIYRSKLQDPEWMRDHQQAARHMIEFINNYKKEAKKVEKMSGYSGLIYRQQHPSIADIQATSGHRAPGYFPELYHRSGGRFYTDQVDEFGGLVYRVQHPSIAEIQANSGHRAPGYFPELYHRSGGRFYTDQVDEFGGEGASANDFLNALWGV